MFLVVVIMQIASALSFRCALAADEGSSEEKIGIYDSRAVAVAFCGSATHTKQITELDAEYERALKAGDTEKVERIKSERQGSQTRMHLQGFSTAPVDDILATIEKPMEKIKTANGLSEIVSKWDKEKLKKYRNAKQLDITMDLVRAFAPNERQMKSAVEIQKVKPCPMPTESGKALDAQSEHR